MPALKMKTKPCTGTGLHVCHKSSKISKNSSSQIRLSQYTAELDGSVDNHHDVFSDIEVSQEIEWDKPDVAHRNLLNGEACSFPESPLSAVESPGDERMDLAPPTCSSNMETIFSPIFEFNEIHSKPNIYNYSAKDDFIFSQLIADEESNSASSNSYGYQTLFDMAERYMILPFLEETGETTNIFDKRACEEEEQEASINSDDSCLYLAIHQLKSCDEQSNFNSHSVVGVDEVDCFDPHLFLRNLPDLSDVVPSVWPLLLPKETRKRKSITLVLDLDETLVHSTLEHCDDADFTFPVFFNMKEHTVYVRQRPYLKPFLGKVAEMFEIIVFTASQSSYAEQLLNILDPSGKLISQRAYRESCLFSDGSYTKDLTVLGVDLAKVALIDNSPQVFRLQVNNGIPIKSWFDDPSDRALVSLLPFLETLVDADDVRPIIAQRFSNNQQQ
ncbi:CTD small phosphatase-like protein 2 isoform X2 [Papaver somniferum]|uniref:CTD small phosphatase-like protein 2 isoform X2 n=1 Tax=Papaver somniferum TaxID=3469 RepID=UPI000E6FF255|nr:CTD small phosphatase-like protein 2 isoform X2 [Papaver somniferum]